MAVRLIEQCVAWFRHGACGILVLLVASSCGGGPDLATPTTVSMTLVVDAGVDRVPDHRFELEVVGGKIVGGPPRLEVAVGDLVEVTVRSDAADYVHLHAYDVSMAVHPGVPAILRMVAAIPGVFEAEMHGSGLRVFELRVS